MIAILLATLNNCLYLWLCRHKELVTEAELKLGKKLFQDFLGGKKLGEVRNQEWKNLEEIIADTWFNAIGMKTVHSFSTKILFCTAAAGIT